MPCSSRLLEASVIASLARKSAESFFDLRGDFQCKGVEALRKVANICQELIIKDYRWDGSDQTRRGGEQRFGNARCHGAQTGRTGGAEAGESVADAPDGAEK